MEIIHSEKEREKREKINSYILKRKIKDMNI